MVIGFPKIGHAVTTLLNGLLLACLVTGCGPTRSGLTGDNWPWGPTTLEIHGLSRFMEVDGEERLSLRIEFLDRDGDPVKFPGQLEIEVDPEGSFEEEERSFSFDLEDLKVNARYWDHVTSTYRFMLDMDWTEPPLPSTPIRVRAIANIPDQGTLANGITIFRGG